MLCEKAFVYQCYCATSASLVILAVGCATGWISPTLKKLESGEHPLLTPDQGSWIAAMHEPGHLIAALPAGILVSRWGPLSCLRIAGSFSVLGWILTLIKVKFWVLCAARICFGVSMGVAFTVVPLYVGEIASPKVRGVLGVMFQSMLYLGHLIEFILGPWLSYVQLALVSLVIPITFLITTFFMVESPYFLLKDGRYDDAGHAYSRLSGETKLQCIELQLHQMQEMLDQSSSYSRGTIKDIFLSGHNRDALLVVLFLAIAQRFSGMSAVVAYASSTFPNTTGGLNASQYTILFGAAVFIFTLVSGIFIDSRGRRPLTLISCAGCCIAELLAAIYYYCFMKTNQYSWIPVVVISCYSCFYSIGLGPVVNVLQGELFAPSVKGISSSIVTVVHASSSFIVTKMSQTIRKHFGIYVQFAIFSFSCFIAFIFGYFCVPETKQKTLQEVQDEAVRNR